MGQMKWIYCMVQDGSYNVFKMMYETAKKNGSDAFIWEGKPFSVILASAVVKVGDKVDQEYDNYLVDQIESYYEWQAEIARGK
tara:strand:+ start:2166 stop:2414 length:249 start_codon:yes stop_codon:yes gene_type:complete